MVPPAHGSPRQAVMQRAAQQLAAECGGAPAAPALRSAMCATQSVSDQMWAQRAQRFPRHTPTTREYYLLREIFEEHFPSQHALDTVPTVGLPAVHAPPGLAATCPAAHAGLHRNRVRAYCACWPCCAVSGVADKPARCMQAPDPLPALAGRHLVAGARGVSVARPQRGVPCCVPACQSRSQAHACGRPELSTARRVPAWRAPPPRPAAGTRSGRSCTRSPAGR